ncbi:MAG: hypothetical protein AB1295_05285 [Candidatus Micrarchaeota archaeon]
MQDKAGYYAAPLSNAMKEYVKNIDNFNYFEYILFQGSKTLIEENSFYLRQIEQENTSDKEELNFVKGTKRKSKFFMPFVRQQVFIFHVHLFEYFLLNIIREIYQRENRALKSCSKMMKISDVALALEENRLLDAVIDTELSEIRNGSYRDLVDYFKKHFGIDLAKSGISDNKIIEIFQLRHVIVHNNGIIDREFKNKVKNKKYVEGKKAYLSSGDFDRVRSILLRMARFIDSKCSTKYKLDSIS